MTKNEKLPSARQYLRPESKSNLCTSPARISLHDGRTHATLPEIPQIEESSDDAYFEVCGNCFVAGTDDAVGSGGDMLLADYGTAADVFTLCLKAHLVLQLTWTGEQAGNETLRSMARLGCSGMKP